MNKTKDSCEIKIDIIQTSLQRLQSQAKALEKLQLPSIPTIIQEHLQVQKIREKINQLAKKHQQLELVMLQNQSNEIVESIERNFRICNSQIQVYKTSIKTLEKQAQEGESRLKRQVKEHLSRVRRESEQRVQRGQKMLQEMLNEFNVNLKSKYSQEYKDIKSVSLQKSLQAEVKGLYKHYEPALRLLQDSVGQFRLAVDYLQYKFALELQQHQVLKESSKADSTIQEILLKEFLQKGEQFMLTEGKHLSSELEQQQDLQAKKRIMSHAKERVYWLQLKLQFYKGECNRRILQIQESNSRSRQDLKSKVRAATKELQKSLRELHMAIAKS